MLTKIMTTISSWLNCFRGSKNTKEQLQLEFLHSSKLSKSRKNIQERFMLVQHQNPQLTSKLLRQKNQKATKAQKLQQNIIEQQFYPKLPPYDQKESLPPKSAEQLQQFYKLIVLEQENTEQLQKFAEEQKQVQEFLENLQIMEDKQREIEEMLAKLSIDDKEIKSVEQLGNQIDKTMKQMKQVLEGERFPHKIYEEYLQNIEGTLSYKYIREKKSDYRQISFEEYRYVVQKVWKWPRQQKQKIQGYTYLTRQDLRFLAFGQWLNDQVISEYLNLLITSYASFYKDQPVPILLDSLQTKSIFEKSDNRKIERILKKRNIILPSNQQQTLNLNNYGTTERVFMAIHKTNHWIFAVLEVFQSKITIYDSLRTNLQTYLRDKTINNMVTYFNGYFERMGFPIDEDTGRYVKVQISQDYPQQNNGYDCGMMMLSGIRDLLRKYRIWSFGQKDINYKRVLVTTQLLNHQIYGI